jgi:hypothetical protein
VVLAATRGGYLIGMSQAIPARVLDLEALAAELADLGLDPTPLLAVVSAFLRLYADALRLPNPTGL